MSLTAYPLCWPTGWPRTDHRWPPRHGFKNNTFTRARDSLGLELERLGARDVVLSTNVPLNISGQPRGDYRDILGDPGVAVYFTYNDREMAMARDAFPAVSDNLRSLALAIEHLRGLERHGGSSMVERAFTGFSALPEPGLKAPWRGIFGYGPDEIVTESMIEVRYRELARIKHPDIGGTDAQMAELNVAREEALAQCGKAISA